MKSICLTMALLLCFLASDLAMGQVAVVQEAAAQESPATKKIKPVFKDGLAEIVPEFKTDWVTHDLWVETDFDSDKDGKMDRMHVSVCRQKQTDTHGLKVPVIYNTSPYFTGTGSTDKEFMWDPNVELNAEPPRHATPPPIPQQSKRPEMSRRYNGTWVPRGFAVVHSSSPGTGLSQGCPTVGGDNEALAPKAVIDWLCGRRKGFASADGSETVEAFWCTGKVGMTGTSYEGTLPIAAATTGVEGLEAIIPDAPNTSYYHYYRSHGLVRHPGGYMGEDVDVLYNFIHSGDENMRDNCDAMVRDGEMAANQDRVTGDYNDFWAGRDYLNKLDHYKTPTLLSHGLGDWNVMPGHSIRVYEALKKRGVPCQLFLHQGGHGGPPSMKIMNAWFTHYLHGVDNGVEDAPRLYVVRENAKLRKPTGYENYPNPGAKPVTLFLSKGGNEVGGLSTKPSADAVLEKFSDNSEVYGGTLAKAASSPHRLIYATQTLAQPVHISGTCKVSIKMACDKPAANLSVWLVSMPWEAKPKQGQSGKTKRIKLSDNLITRGWADPQNHASLTQSEPLVPGEFQTVTFTLEPDDQIVAAGQRIGLMIFSSDRDFTLWPKPGTELTVDLDGTTLELPIVGGEDALGTSANASR